VNFNNLKMTMRKLLFSNLVLPALLASALLSGLASAATADPSVDKERKLIAVLQSDSPPGDKAVACKQLAIYGTKDAVPALAVFLSDERLASWARIALEAIPGPAPDKALREAMGKLQGRLLVGVINSIAVRRDAKAVRGLVKRLHDSDAEVASAAAVALGRIGGAKAGRALKESLAAAPPDVRGAVAEGCILWAEGALARKQAAEAVRFYDAVRAAGVPKERVLEATRGAILARQSAGLPLLLEQLRSEDKALFGIGLRTARELPGSEVTQALADELDHIANPNRQVFLLLALADRKDSTVLPVVISIARTGSPKLRLAAVGALDRRGDPASLPALLEAATADDPELAQAATAALARLPGDHVDADLLARLPQSAGKTRQILIQIATQRRMKQALHAIEMYAQDTDAAVRAAAVQAMGALGTDSQILHLVQLLENTHNPEEREGIEAALIAISGRSGAACAPSLLPLVHNDDSALRVIALHVLANAGGSQALSAATSALEDAEEAVRDEAVRTLATWPNNWPDDREVAGPLLTLAKSGQKPSYQTLGLRGYLQCVQGDKQLAASDKVEKVNALMPLLKKAEEKRLAIAVISASPTAGALEMLLSFAAEPAVADDACAALVKLADKNPPGLSKERRQQALQAALDQSKNDETKKRAEELLKAQP
jgi:HEAT repeat protein